MHVVFARKIYLVQALQSTSSSWSLNFSACVGVCSNTWNYSSSCQPCLEVGDRSAKPKAQVCLKACDYSTSSQPSLELEDTSAGEVHEESQIKKSNCEKENFAEVKEELASETQLLKKVQPQLLQDQEGGSKKSPLKVIVRSYAKHWFKEHLRIAEKGNSDAQAIVGQMISHGYGVPRDVGKGEEWIRRASRRQKQSKESSGKKRSQDEDLYFIKAVGTGDGSCLSIRKVEQIAIFFPPSKLFTNSVLMSLEDNINIVLRLMLKELLVDNSKGVGQPCPIKYTEEPQNVSIVEIVSEEEALEM
ncbi:hypothetical protein L7F22_056356 [Adiantum nelumboides]|nr:hypothetical protein [Adiantum nelumboides]